MSDESSTREMDRGPRIHIQYTLQTGNATKKIDLPLVMGAMMDLSGDNANRPDLEDRKFAPVVGGNVTKLMESVSPKFTRPVTNHLLTGEPGKPVPKLPVDLTFTSMADFSPDRIAQRVPELLKLLEVSRKLGELERATASKGMRVESILKQILDEVRARQAAG